MANRLDNMVKALCMIHMHGDYPDETKQGLDDAIELLRDTLEDIEYGHISDEKMFSRFRKSFNEEIPIAQSVYANDFPFSRNDERRSI